MGNAVSPNLNDTEHQLLRDNSGKHFSAVATVVVCYVALSFWWHLVATYDLYKVDFGGLFIWKYDLMVILVADSTPPLNTLLPSPGAWPYSASDSPLNNAHNSGNNTVTCHLV